MDALSFDDWINEILLNTYYVLDNILSALSILFLLSLDNNLEWEFLLSFYRQENYGSESRGDLFY